MASYETGGRLSAIRVAEAGLAADVSALVTAAALSLSITATSQLELTLADPALALVAGKFMPKRTPVTYAGLRLEVAVREIVTVGTGTGTTPGFKATARATSVQQLKRRVGGRVWAGLSYTQWLAAEARAVGAGFVGQPSPRRTQVVRKADKGQPRESSWDTANRAAGELGFIVFEAAGVIYFGRPSWLATRAPRHIVKWAGAGAAGTDPGLLAVPNVRDSDDDLTHGFTGSLSCTLELAEQLMPGHGLILTGLGQFSAGPFLISDTTLDLMAAGSPQTVQVLTPVDPVPQPPAKP